MSENGTDAVNGNGSDAVDENGYVPEPTRDRDENGHFLPGNAVGRLGGRPPGSMDFMTICRKYAARTKGVTLEGVVEEALESLRAGNKAGDVSATRELLNRLCGVLDKTPTTAIQINGADAVNIAEQTRDEVRKLMGDDETQGAVLDELAKRGDGDGV